MPENDNLAFDSNGTIPDVDRFTFERFNLRFKELWANWDDLKENGINLSGNFELQGDGRIHGRNELGVDRFRLKGFFMDYRHFAAQKEPIEFGRICNLIKKHFNDSRVCSVIDHEKKRWKNCAGLSSWHPNLTAEQFLLAEINENYFHSNATNEKNITLEEVRSKMSEDARLYEMTYIVYERLLCIRNLNVF